MILTIQLLQKGSYYDLWGTRNFFYYTPFLTPDSKFISNNLGLIKVFLRKTLQTTVENLELMPFQIMFAAHYSKFEISAIICYGDE